MTGSNKKSTQLWAFALGGVAVFVVMAYALGFLGSSASVRYVALLDDAAGIVDNNAVKIAGVQVGKVASVGVQGNKARLELRLDADLALYEDCQVSVRAKSLLGEKYLQLVPGSESSPRLAPGATLEQGQATFEVDQLLNSLKSMMGEGEPLSERLASILARSDRLMAKLEEPEVERAMSEDLARVRKLLDETGAVAESLRLILHGQEEHLRARMVAAADWIGDPRWAKVLARVDRLSAQLEKDMPSLLATTKDTASASKRLLERADQSLDEPTMRALAKSVQDLQVISQQGARLSKDLGRLQTKLKRGPLRQEEVGELLHALHTISERAAAVDEVTLRRFLQKEGMKIFLGRGSDARRQVERAKGR